jgi:DNA-binding NtrC family response regulator
MDTTSILVVGDDPAVHKQAQAALVAEGMGPVASLPDGDELDLYLAEHACALVMLDLDPRTEQGVRMIGDITSRHPKVSVVAVSGADEVATAVSCIHQGAYDYLVKPLVPRAVASVVRRALGLRRQRLAPLAPRAGSDAAFADIVTADPAMRAVFAYLHSVATTGQPVLIVGETGTGKDLVARAVHQLSGRSGSFVAVNMGGMDDTMFADTLFGHRRGAFTGASDLRPGLVLGASGGTLFLDEIGDLNPVSQVKLLRLLQDGDYYPLGCDQPKVSTARVVAATSADLGRLKTGGRFRKDLFYRLNAHLVELPPLRERRGDLPLLLRHFTDRATGEMGRPPLVIDDALPGLLATYPFPGNIRELRSLVYDAVCRSAPGGPLCLDPFRRAVGRARESDEASSLRFPAVLPSYAQMKELLVCEALRRAQGNQALAAERLGISRQALNKRLRK